MCPLNPSSPSALLLPVDGTPLVWVLVRKGAQCFYTIRCCASQAERWSRGRPQGNSLAQEAFLGN